MLNHQTGRPVEILIVEDNPTDVLLAQEALESTQLCANTQVVGDGQEAIMYLRKEGKYANASRPDLILLDLNLPIRDGFDVLTELKCDVDLRRIPVVVLTTSKEQTDVMKAYDLNANCFVTKPIDFNQFLSVVQGIKDFWFTYVTLPKG